MGKISLTVEQREKFNRYFVDQEQRNISMSIFSSIKYWQDEELGVLPFSLDKLYTKYKNKFYLTLSNFKKIANKLVSLGFLKTIKKGRLKFYGTSDCKSDDEVREENKKLKDENLFLREELEKMKREMEELKKEIRAKANNVLINETKEEKEEYSADGVSQEVVIETAYAMMKEAGIEDGSTPFRQVIESLYYKTDKAIIHNKGLVNYIKKVIHNKVHNQAKFREIIKNARRSQSEIFMTKSEEDRLKELERRLLGWDKG